MKRLPTPSVAILVLLALLAARAPAGEKPGKPQPPKKVEKDGASPREAPDDDGKDTVRLADVLVTLGKSPHLTLSVSVKDIERDTRSVSLEDLLSSQPGVDLNRTSATGPANRRLTIRGFDESRYSIQLGRRDLRGAGVYGGYYVDWFSQSLEDVERVEIIRGASPVKHGNTLGGIVNVVPRKPSFRLANMLKIAGGTSNTGNVMAVHSWGLEPVAYKVAASAFLTDGHLRNASSERYTFSSDLLVKLPLDLELTVRFDYSQTEAGMLVYNGPDSPYYEANKPDSLDAQLGGPYLPFLDHGTGKWGPLDWGDGSFWRDERRCLDVALQHKGKAFSAAFRAFIMDNLRHEHFRAVTDPGLPVVDRRSKPEQDNGGWKFDGKNTLELEGTHTLEYGLEGHYLGYGGSKIEYVDPSYFPPWRVPADYPGKARISMRHGGFLQDTYRCTDWLLLDGGLRFDHFEAEGPEDNAPCVVEPVLNLSLGATVGPFEGFQVRARYRRASRFPTLPEYYWWYGGYQPAARGKFRAELADQLELEVSLKKKKAASLSARAYYYQVHDYIRTIFGYTPSRVIYNIDRVDLAGVEVEGSLFVARGIRAWANYTWQYSKKHGDALDQGSALTDQIAELPEHKLNVGASFKMDCGLEVAVKLRWVSQRQSVRGNLAKPGCWLADMDAYVDAGADVRYAVWTETGGGDGGRCELFASFSNLFDQRYEERYGYPAPGFTAQAGLFVKF